jgi:dTDP-4-dehydrorhamnose 3,5-epimerase
MRIISTSIHGLKIIKSPAYPDKRGYFEKLYSRELFKSYLLNTCWPEMNSAWNAAKGTLRGIHWQSPFPEIKMVRCTSGSVYDVVVDMRIDSPTYLMHEGFELSALDNTQLYIPKGCGHSYITLQDNSCVDYLISEKWYPEYYRGCRYDDPKLGIKWPTEIVWISEQDEKWTAL